MTKLTPGMLFDMSDTIRYGFEKVINDLQGDEEAIHLTAGVKSMFKTETEGSPAMIVLTTIVEVHLKEEEG